MTDPKPARQRVAIVVFADVEGEISDPQHVAERVIRDKLGPMRGEVHTVRLGGRSDGRELGVRFHEVMEAGIAIGNGYLWTSVTSKAFRQYTWQAEGEEQDG